MKTDKEIIEFVYDKLMIQGKRSYGPYVKFGGEEIGCLYRGPNGLKCAAGWLIPDDKYRVEMENVPATIGIVFTALEDLGYTSQQISLIRSLQGIHDRLIFDDPKNFRHELRKDFIDFARKRNLNCVFKNLEHYENSN